MAKTQDQKRDATRTIITYLETEGFTQEERDEIIRRVQFHFNPTLEASR